MNAISHGVTGQNLFLQQAEMLPYMQLGRDFFAEWRPVGIREVQYVQRLIDANWRLNRAGAIDNNLLNTSLVETAAEADVKDRKLCAMLSQAVAYHRDCQAPDAFDKITRYEAHLRRAFLQFESELTVIQQKRIAKNGDKFILADCQPYNWYVAMVALAVTPAASLEIPVTPSESEASSEQLLCKKHAAVLQAAAGFQPASPDPAPQ
jgi:hypothetical protein